MNVIQVYQELMRKRIKCSAFWEKGIEACKGCSYEQREQCFREFDRIADECWKEALELVKKEEEHSVQSDEYA